MAELGDTLTTLFAQNQAWSEVMKEVDSSFFDQLSSGHKPKCFWIGCSDARVSPNQITASKLGGCSFIEISVTRSWRQMQHLIRLWSMCYLVWVLATLSSAGIIVVVEYEPHFHENHL